MTSFPYLSGQDFGGPPLILYPSTRKGALAVGAKFYFTGKPCKRGHVDKRGASSRICVPCNSERNAAWRVANRERKAENAKAWRTANRERQAEYNKAYYAANRESEAERNAAWRVANSDKVNAATARRRARKLNATPCWADKAHMDLLYRFRERLQRATGVDYHVDHIVALKGITEDADRSWMAEVGLTHNVSGLHVHHNLRVVEASTNMAKKNNCPPEHTIKISWSFVEPTPYHGPLQWHDKKTRKIKR